MAEHSGSEVIAEALASVLVFFGALGAAIKFWPEKGSADVIAEKLKELERRQTEMDRRIDDVFHLLDDVRHTLTTCQVGIADALARLQERRK